MEEEDRGRDMGKIERNSKELSHITNSGIQRNKGKPTKLVKWNKKKVRRGTGWIDGRGAKIKVKWNRKKERRGRGWKDGRVKYMAYQVLEDSE